MKFFLYNDQSIICMILVNTGGSRGSADMCPPSPTGPEKCLHQRLEPPMGQHLTNRKSGPATV